MEKEIVTETVYAVIPLNHLGQIVAAYLAKVGAVSPNDKIHNLDLPVATDDENNVTVRLGIAKGIVN